MITMDQPTTDLADLKRHPFSAVFGAIDDGPDDDSNYKSLCQSIGERGLREPIVLLDGMVLDGWHRYLACLDVGEPVRYREFDAERDDPVCFVLDLNMERRHLTASQRASIRVRLAKERDALPSHGGTRPGAFGEKPCGATTSTQETTLSLEGEPIDSIDSMARDARVHPNTIKDAVKAEKAGMGDEVRAGKVSASAAAKKARGTDKKPKPKKPKPKPKPTEKKPTREERMQAMIDGLEMQIQDVTLENDKLRRKVKFFEDSDRPVDSAKYATLNAAIAEIDTLQGRLADSHRELKDLQGRHNGLKRRHKKLQRDYDRLKADYDELSGESD